MMKHSEENKTTAYFFRNKNDIYLCEIDYIEYKKTYVSITEEKELINDIKANACT